MIPDWDGSRCKHFLLLCEGEDLQGKLAVTNYLRWAPSGRSRVTVSIPESHRTPQMSNQITGLLRQALR